MNYAVYIVAALVLIVLIALVALSISWLQKTVLRNIRSKTLSLISAYDELLEEKSQALAQLAAQEVRQVEVVVQTPSPEVPEARPEMSTAVLNTIQRSAASDYREADIGSYYQVIRENFSFDLKAVLPELEKVAPSGVGPATALLEKLDYDTVYQLSTLTREDQLQILRSVLTQPELALLEDHVLVNKDFSVLGFYDSLKAIAASEPGKARLRVSPSAAQYCTCPGTVEILGDPEICEGFQIEQDNRLYDFSIKTRELS